jgi:hypothetical protein
VAVGRSAEPRLQTKARRARSKYPLDPQSLWPKRAFNTLSANNRAVERRIEFARPPGCAARWRVLRGMKGSGR